MEQDIVKETEKVVAIINHEDVITQHEREVVATQAHLRLKQKALE